MSTKLVALQLIITEETALSSEKAGDFSFIQMYNTNTLNHLYYNDFKTKGHQTRLAFTTHQRSFAKKKKKHFKWSTVI